jgi:hypothetical protein
MARAAIWITSSSRGCGAASNTKTQLGGFGGGTHHYVKSSSLCSQHTFTITGPKPETISRSFTPSAHFDPTDSLCYNWMDGYFVNVAGNYRLEAGDLGGFDFTITANAENADSHCPDKAICSKPTGPPPPPPPPPTEKFYQRYLVGQPCGPLGCSFRPYSLSGIHRASLGLARGGVI